MTTYEASLQLYQNKVMYDSEAENAEEEEDDWDAMELALVLSLRCKK